MPSGPIGFRFTWAVTLTKRSRIASRKPAFMERAMRSVVTPAAIRMLFGVSARWGTPLRRRGGPGFGRFGAQERKQNDFANRVGVGEQHHDPIDSDSLARRGRQAVAKSADVISIHFLGGLLTALFHLRAKSCILIGGVVQLGEAVRQFHACDKQ